MWTHSTGSGDTPHFVTRQNDLQYIICIGRQMWQAIWLQGSLLYLWHLTKGLLSWQSARCSLCGYTNCPTAECMNCNCMTFQPQKLSSTGFCTWWRPSWSNRCTIAIYCYLKCSTSLPTFEAMMLYHISSSSITVALEYTHNILIHTYSHHAVIYGYKVR